MNAATGEIYVQETDDTILGSACCALDLKFKNKFLEDPDICVILVGSYGLLLSFNLFQSFI